MQLRKLARCGLVFVVVVLVGCGGKKSDDDKKPARSSGSKQPVSAEPVDCTAGAGIVAKAWNGTVKQNMKAGFTASAVPHAADTFKRVSARLDGAAKQLAAASKGMCKPMRAACLKRRATALGTFISALTKPEKRGVERAVRAVYRLTEAADCANAARIASAPPGASTATRLEQLYAHIDRLRVRLYLGRTKGVQLQLKAVVFGAQRVGYGPALAEAVELQARAYRAKNKLNHAQQRLRVAAKTATAVGDHWRAASVWIELVAVLVDANRAKVALKVVKGAELALKKTNADPLLRRRLHEAVALVHFHTSRYADAVAETKKAEALLRKGDAIGSAKLLFLRAAALQGDKKHADALAVYNTLHKIVRVAFGPKHPMLGRVLIALGTTQIGLARVEEGIGTVDSAVKLFSDNYGADSLYVASARSALASALVSAKKFPRALAEYNKALIIRQKKSSKTVGRTHLDIARALAASGDKKPAATAAKRAREVFEKARSKGGVAAADKLLKKLSGK